MTDREGRVFAFVTGGGTGGHVYPALAIADALVADGHDRSSIRFVGARRGLEARAVPNAGYSIELLTLDGIQRSFAPRDVLRSVRALFAFGAAFGHCVRHLRAAHPAVVVGVGGYASAPCVLAACITRVPTVIHEQNAVPGLVNRIAVRLGAHAAVSFSDSPWPRSVMTGNPVRAEVAAVVRNPMDPPVLAIVGGSLGAGRLNDVALGLYDRWRDRDDIAIHHVAGPHHGPDARTRLEHLRRPGDRLAYTLVDYESDMAGLYQRSALLLCRAGATTVAEAAAVGIGAVYVPWSGSAGGQQVANAQVMVRIGAGVAIADADCDLERVEPLLARLLGDRDELLAMSSAARSAGRPDASARVCSLIAEVARDAA